MPQSELFILMGMGGVFLLLGISSFVWSKKEERDYYDLISSRPDLREFYEHEPERPEHNALKIGGRIAFILGLLMVLFSGAFLLWG